jgi:hypothetical protein
MNLLEDVINRPKIPIDLEGKLAYHSEWLVAVTLIETYGYIIENGFEYSYLTAGEVFDSLQYKEAKPHTLY